MKEIQKLTKGNGTMIFVGQQVCLRAIGDEVHRSW